ncbi:putative 1-acyl-sn-glycerol-3-phosphate acyltransferase [Erysiphe neolycopersici]|uniref:1-acyl-sn-glycerol-3-phosphate acyltransferase n=1 Tax=Erysiphe neolycopersici TaxID=212602 RepID=A0A420HVM3_9PEZI|nr:putative 1-acyl-sn-glycerol-3-phosphate acyltransferase [Erysiphe neolycopersici]
MSHFIYYVSLGIASYISLTIALYLLSIFVPVAGFFARLLAAYASLIFCASVGVFSSLILRLAGCQGISQWFVARCFKYTMWYTTGITFIIDDPNDYLNKTRPAVFIGNHQTELDVLMLACIFPKWCSVTAKKSLQNMPFLGWFMALSGTVFIDRANSNNARQAMSGATAEITKGRQSVYMFPEGTRSYAKVPKLLPFKKGAFHLAVQAGVPIVPVIVANYSHILNPRTLTFKAGKIPIRVLQPIETKNLTSADVDELTRETQELMLKELINLTSEAQK